MIRVRFAPSPTGHLHVGGLRSAIFNYLFAKKMGGQYLLRIEDTDVERSKQEYVDSILKTFEWMSMTPDEDIVFQMDRIKEHKAAVQRLVDAKLAYPCFCEVQKREIGQKYPGTCRNKTFSQEDLEKPHAIRFKIPDNRRRIEFKDLIRGRIKVDIDQLDDFVILRREGVPTYNFVVVLDDMNMKISHVIRGEDHISNTPKQILLYEAFGVAIPEFAHIPLILGKSGARLSKRDAATSVEEYKNAGYIPDALFNYMVRLGWSHGDQEIFSREELINLFSLEKVGKKGAIFDIKKLNWLNGFYIRNLSLREFLFELDEDMISKLKNAWPEKLGEIYRLYQQRATTTVELAESMFSLSVDPKELDISLLEKWKSDSTHMLVQDYITELENLNESDHDILLNIANDICERYGCKLVELAQALRLGLCGKLQSPGVFDLILALGKDRSVKRLKFLLEEFRKNESDHIVEAVL